MGRKRSVAEDSVFVISSRTTRHIYSVPSSAGLKTKRSPRHAFNRSVFTAFPYPAFRLAVPHQVDADCAHFREGADITSRNRADRRCASTPVPARWTRPSEREVESEACSHQVAVVVSMVAGRSNRPATPPQPTDQETFGMRPLVLARVGDQLT